jgi:hypothetical protein
MVKKKYTFFVSIQIPTSNESIFLINPIIKKALLLTELEK